MTADHPFPPGASVVAYLRDSGGDRQELSTTQQEQEVRRYCQQAGLVLTRIFVDAARSGKSTIGRDEFNKLVTHFTEAEPTEQGVVIWNYARWARDFDDSQYYIASIRRKGYEVYSLTQPVPGGAVGRIVEATYAAMAEEYRVELSKNVKRGMRYLVEHYHAHFGPAPVGYTEERAAIGRRRSGDPHEIRRLVIDEATASRVRRAFELRRDGYTVYEIHQETGLLQDPGSYGRMFTNPIYLGIFRWGGERFPGHCEPLVDSETFEACQQLHERFRAKRRAGTSHPRRAGSAYALSGLAVCARCGQALVGSRFFRGVAYYRCRHKLKTLNSPSRCGAPLLPAAELERLVLERLKAVILDPVRLAGWYAEARALAARSGADTGAELKAAQDELRQVQRAIENLVRIAEQGGDDDGAALLLDRLTGRKVERQAIQERVALLKARAPAKFPDLSPEQVQAVGQRMIARLEASPRDRQLALRELVTAVRAERVGGVIVGQVEIAPPFPGAAGAVVAL